MAVLTRSLMELNELMTQLNIYPSSNLYFPYLSCREQQKTHGLAELLSQQAH